MLVLTRRPSESVIIAGDIKITVVSVGPGRVKLGIEAPPHVRIDRQEIHDKIEQAADVLTAVSNGEVNGDSYTSTMVVSAADTSTNLEPSAQQPVGSKPPVVPPLGKLGQFRASRKPR
jgi:carbon storage regulator